MLQKINTFLVLPYSVNKIYFLVNDVESYYEFLPYCTSSRILKIQKNYMIASIDFIKYGIKKTLITKNEFILNKNIKINLINQSFLNLKGQWNFIKINKKKCIAKFNIEFEFFDIFLKKVVNLFLKDIILKITNSFYNRAKKIFSEKN